MARNMHDNDDYVVVGCSIACNGRQLQSNLMSFPRLHISAYQLLINRCCLLMQIDPLLEKGMGTFSKAEQGKKKRQMDWGQRYGKSQR